MNPLEFRPATPSGTASVDANSVGSDGSPEDPVRTGSGLNEAYAAQKSWVATYALPALLAAAAHAAVALSGGKPPPKAAAAVDLDQGSVMVQLQPEIEPLEEEAASEDTPQTNASMESFSPPQLVDTPSIALDAVFVQQLQFTSPQVSTVGLLTIPKGPARPEGIANQVTKVFSLDVLDRIPELIQGRPPIYPRDLLRLGIGGEVRVAFVVGDTGEVRDVQVVSSSHRGFDTAAINSVTKYRFKPGIYRGRPVASHMERLIKFEPPPK